MRKRTALVIALLFFAAACGGNDDGGGDEAGSDETVAETGAAQSGGDGGAEEVADQQPPGQATVLLQGETYTLDTVGPAGCTIDGTGFEVSFLSGDNDVNLVGGGDASEPQFNFNFGIQGDGAVMSYSADSRQGDSGTLVVVGSSMSYVGSMAELAESGEREPVGEVTISATCN